MVDLKLRALHYKWTKIATILGLSRATLYRRLKEAGVSSDDYTQVSDKQLDEVICSIKQDHPNDDEVLLQGHQQGIKVPHLLFIMPSIVLTISVLSLESAQLSDVAFIQFPILIIFGT